MADWIPPEFQQRPPPAGGGWVPPEFQGQSPPPEKKKMSFGQNATGSTASIIDIFNPIPIAVHTLAYIADKDIIGKLKPWERDLFGLGPAPTTDQERAAHAKEFANELAGKISGGFTALYHAFMGEEETPTEAALNKFSAGASKMSKSIGDDYQSRTNGAVRSEDVQEMIQTIPLGFGVRMGKKGAGGKPETPKPEAAKPPSGQPDIHERWARPEEPAPKAKAPAAPPPPQAKAPTAPPTPKAEAPTAPPPEASVAPPPTRDDLKAAARTDAQAEADWQVSLEKEIVQHVDRINASHEPQAALGALWEKTPFLAARVKERLNGLNSYDGQKIGQDSPAPRTGSRDGIPLAPGAKKIPPRSIDSAVEKAKSGQPFLMSAEEKIALRDAEGGRKAGITDSRGRFIAAAALGTGVALASQFPEDGNAQASIAAVGGALLLGRGKGLTLEETIAHPATSPLEVLRAKLSTSWATLERLPGGQHLIPEKMLKDTLNREGVTKAEKELFATALAGAEFPLPARDLVARLQEASGNFELKTVETEKSAYTGISTIRPKGGGSSRSTIYQSPLDLGVLNHFDDPNYFAHTRAFEEEGIRHTFEVQSDMAQHAGKRLEAGERVRLDKEFSALESAHIELDKIITDLDDRAVPPHPISESLRSTVLELLPEGDPLPQQIVSPGWVMRAFDLVGFRMDAVQKQRGNPLADPIRPMLKDWWKRIIRESLASDSREGRPAARYATADTAAKVQGWPKQFAIPKSGEFVSDSRKGTLTEGRTIGANEDFVSDGRITISRGHLFEEGNLVDPSRRPIRPSRLWRSPQSLTSAERKALGITESFSKLEHKSIHDRYRGDIEPFLLRLGGVSHTDPQGHTWIEIPLRDAAGKPTIAGGPRAQMFGKAKIDAILMVASGSAAFAATAYLSDHDKLENALTAGALGTVAPLLARTLPGIKQGWRVAAAESAREAIIIGAGAYAGSDKDPSRDHTLLGAVLGLGFASLAHLKPTARILKNAEGVTIDQMALSLEATNAIHRQEGANLERAFKAGLPEDVRKALPGMIEKNDLSSLTPEQRKFATLWKNFASITADAAIGAGLMREALANYITHIVEKIPSDLTAIDRIVEKLMGDGPSGVGTQVSPFTKLRKHATLEEVNKAIEGSGLRIKTTDIAEIARTYNDSMWGAIERKKFVDVLKNSRGVEGAPTWIAPEKTAPRDYVHINSPLLKDVRVHPDAAGVVNYLIGRHELGTMLNSARLVGSMMKRGIFLGSLFHAKSLAEAAVLATGTFGIKEVFRELGNAGGKLAGKDDLFGRSAIRKALDDFENAGVRSQAAQRAGLNLEHIMDIDLDAWREGGKIVDSFMSQIGLPMERLKPFERTFGAVENLQKQTFDKFIWGYVHTGGKLAVWSKLVEREILKDAKKPEGRRLGQEEIERQVADSVNAVMGGQNWLNVATQARTQLGRELALMAISPRGKAITGLASLAPDWNFSTFRAMLQALPGGKAGPVTKSLARDYLFRSMIYNFLIVDQLNNAFSGHHVWDREQKDSTRMELGDGTTAMQMGKHANEVWEFMREPKQTLVNKAGPLPKLAAELATGKQWINTKGYAPDIENYPAHIAGAFASISLKGALIPWRTPEETFKRTVLGIAGLPVTGESEEEKRARKEWQKEHSDEKKRRKQEAEEGAER